MYADQSTRMCCISSQGKPCSPERVVRRRTACTRVSPPAPTLKPLQRRQRWGSGAPYHGRKCLHHAVMQVKGRLTSVPLTTEAHHAPPTSFVLETTRGAPAVRQARPSLVCSSLAPFLVH